MTIDTTEVLTRRRPRILRLFAIHAFLLSRWAPAGSLGSKSMGLDPGQLLSAAWAKLADLGSLVVFW